MTTRGERSRPLGSCSSSRKAALRRLRAPSIASFTVDSPFAQALFPEKAKSKKGRGTGNEVDGKTGQRKDQDADRTYAQILKATQSTLDGGGGGGFPGGGGMGGGKAEGGFIEAMMKGSQSSLLDEGFDKEEFMEVMKKVCENTDAAKARGEDVAPKAKAAGRTTPTRPASRGKKAPGSDPKERSRSPVQKEAEEASKTEPTAPTATQRWPTKVSL